MELYDLNGGSVRILGLPYDSLEDALGTAAMLTAVSGEVVTVSSKLHGEVEYVKKATVYPDGHIEMERKPSKWKIVS